MASLVNSIEYLKKKLYWYFTNSSKNKREHFPTHIMRPSLPWLPMPEKTLQENYRPISLAYEYTSKNTQQNFNKPNPAIYKKDYTPWLYEVYPWNIDWFHIRKSGHVIYLIIKIRTKNSTWPSQQEQKRFLTKSNIHSW